MRRLLGAAVTVVLVAIGLSLAMVPAARVLGQDALLIRSGSMGRTAPVGSLVLVRPTPVSSVKVGTIVAVRPGGAVLPTLHRVVALDRTAEGVVARTKGDANTVEDPDPRVLHGSVPTPTHVVPWIGYLVGATRTWTGWLLLILLPGAIVLAILLRSIWATRTNEADADDEVVATTPTSVSPDADDVLEGARLEAQRIIDDARVEAEQLRRDAAVQHATVRAIVADLMRELDARYPDPHPQPQAQLTVVASTS